MFCCWVTRHHRSHRMTCKNLEVPNQRQSKGEIFSYLPDVRLTENVGAENVGKSSEYWTVFVIKWHWFDHFWMCVWQWAPPCGKLTFPHVVFLTTRLRLCFNSLTLFSWHCAAPSIKIKHKNKQPSILLNHCWSNSFVLLSSQFVLFNLLHFFFFSAVWRQLHFKGLPFWHLQSLFFLSYDWGGLQHQALVNSASVRDSFRSAPWCWGNSSHTRCRMAPMALTRSTWLCRAASMESPVDEAL